MKSPVATLSHKDYDAVLFDLDGVLPDVHPVHLHRFSFELTRVYGKPTAGAMKDVVVVKSYQQIEVDVTPQTDGLALFHCHQQLHMDSASRCSSM